MLTLVKTADGSSTLFNVVIGEHYHSRHGALQESRHVFLESGLRYFLDNNTVNEIKVIEVGFGTGLNFILSAEYCLLNKTRLSYTGIEAYPLNSDILNQTGYKEYVSNEIWDAYFEHYSAALQEKRVLNEYCTLEIAAGKLLEFTTAEQFDVVYFDAFAAIHQPEMWDYDAVKHITSFLKPGGVFVTYAITGNLKRTMKALGFAVEKAPGAPGKREMLRAVKTLV